MTPRCPPGLTCGLPELPRGHWPAGEAGPADPGAEAPAHPEGCWDDRHQTGRPPQLAWASVILEHSPLHQTGLQK